jgi:TP901-1 family phage major tail protein
MAGNAQLGRDLLFKYNISGTTYVSLAKQRNTTFTVNKDPIDITSKDDESTFNGSLWRRLLPQGGVHTMEITLDGVFADSTSDETFRTKMLAGTHIGVNALLPGTTNGAGGQFEGNFEISSIDFTGTYDGAVEYTTTLTSAGEIKFDDLPLNT